MKSHIDAVTIKRRAALANLASVGGLLVLLASVALPYFRSELAGAASVLMVVGLAASMTGIYFANRWVKRPRPEAVLDQALKSLTDNYQLYHYPRLAADHILLTPTGVLVIETVNLEGVFTCRAGRWRERMNLGRSLRWIVEEHLGNPAQAALSAADNLRSRLGEAVPLRAVVVFTHPHAVLDIEGAPLPVLLPEKLKKHAVEKTPRLSAEVYAGVEKTLSDLI